MMNRHFYNFVAAFNAASKTSKSTFSFALRNKMTLVILDLLVKEGVIMSYQVSDKLYFDFFGNQRFGKKGSNFYTAVNVYFRSGVFPKIESVSTPGKQFPYPFLKLNRLCRAYGPGKVIIVSSSSLGKICNAREVVAAGEGALVLFIVHS
jgi:ribosomal protein S8